MDPDKPPSYSNLPPPTFDEALAADREKAKKGKCMRVSVALISTVLVCMCLGGFVLAVVFGFWMVQCQRTGSVSAVSLGSSFKGEGTKQVTIKIDGGVSITPSFSQSSEVFSTILVSSPKKDPNPASTDNGILVANESDYVIIRRKGFWRCSRFVAKVSILDLAAGSPSSAQAEGAEPPPSPFPLSPLSLFVSSTTGDIQVREFEGRIFKGIELVSQTGVVTAAGVRVEGDLRMSAGGEGVGVFHSNAQNIALLTGAGGISIGNATASNFQVNARQGNILTSTLFLSSSSNCEAIFSTSVGTIQIQQLTLEPTSHPCKILISSKSGDIHLGLRNFSGKYSIQASQGNAKTNSHLCGHEICQGRVGNEAALQHELVVMNGRGNIDVSFF